MLQQQHAAGALLPQHQQTLQAQAQQPAYATLLLPNRPAIAPAAARQISNSRDQQAAANAAPAAPAARATQHTSAAGGCYIGNSGFNASRAQALLAAQAAAAAAAAAPAVQGPAGDQQQARHTSSYRGVCWNKRSQRWQAAINSRSRQGRSSPDMMIWACTC
jgi:hypothetical protein